MRGLYESQLKWGFVKEIVGVFHSTKISGNSCSKSNGTEIFRKFVSEMRLSVFLEIWTFRKFPVPFGISTRYELTPVPLVVKSYIPFDIRKFRKFKPGILVEWNAPRKYSSQLTRMSVKRTSIVCELKGLIASLQKNSCSMST